MIKSTQFQKTYFSSKNHPTLKSLWQNLIAAMKWAELDVDHLQAIAGQKIQFRYPQ
jgi:hypothetical protein